MNTLY